MGSILIVEDDARFRTMLARTLEQRGWRVGAAGSVAAGREALRAGIYDVLLLDLGLPDGVGWDVAAWAPGIPIVVMTGREVAAEERDAYRPASVMQKPIGLDELFDLLEPYSCHT